MSFDWDKARQREAERQRLGEAAVALYADGGTIISPASRWGGVWAWCAVNRHGYRVHEASGLVPAPPGRPVTNNHMEQIAITLALEAMPNGWDGAILSDSSIALGRVFLGWKENNLPRNISVRSQLAVARMGHVDAILLKGHPNRYILATGLCWAYEFPTRRTRSQRGNYLGPKAGKVYDPQYFDKPLDQGSLTVGRARRLMATVYPVSHHNVWCDEACKVLATEYKRKNIV